MKKSPLYYKSGMGTPSKGSPIPLWAAAGRAAIQGGKYLLKNWKSLLAGEAGFLAGEKLLEGGGTKSEKSKQRDKNYHERTKHGFGTPKI